MTMDVLQLLLGLVCAGAGGELFIRGAVGLAHWARIPPGIVGATVAAFATSSPELSVAISSAMTGDATISVGDAVGSNVVNIGVILGVALLMSPTPAPREGLKRDFPVALLAPFGIGLLSLDGNLSRLDGAILLMLFFTWLIATVIEARRARAAAQEGALTQEVLTVKPGFAVLYSLVGLGLLALAGRFIVTGAVGIATAWGMDSFVIGATVVALGTSVPEVATAVLAKARGHEEVALGTVLGSNIFNGLFIVGTAAVLSPMAIPFLSIVAGLTTGALLTACSYPPANGILERRRGALLLGLYMIYMVVLLQSGHQTGAAGH